MCTGQDGESAAPIEAPPTNVGEQPPGDLALAAIAIAPAALSHRTQPRPKATTENPAGWPWLTVDEIEEALKLKSADLVEEIHALSLRLLLAEDQRESRIDAKAQGLLVTAGLSLTAASTFGGMLLHNTEQLEKAVGTNGTQIVMWGYALGLLAGLAASFLALLALFVKKTFRTVDERDALANDALTIAEREGTGARAAYRRYMTVHYWQMWQKNFTVLESKARTIKWGQLFFIVFLVSLMALGSIMAYTSLDGFLTS